MITSSHYARMYNSAKCEGVFLVNVDFILFFCIRIYDSITIHDGHDLLCNPYFYCYLYHFVDGYAHINEIREEE